MHRFVVTFAALSITSPVIAFGADAAPAGSAQKAILVTGASTGIGRTITEQLAAGGYFVYAGARKESDLKELAAIRNVQAVRLDVTKQEDITAAVDTVRKGGRGLYALVNNAGVGTLGPVVGGNDAEFDLTMDVNVRGVYRVTKAFAPMIIASRGRITSIGSISGILAGANASAYTMSKHAIEAFTDSLAQEMVQNNVLVSVVEPGNYNSNIAKNAVERLKADPKLADRSRFKEPDEVAAAVSLALFEATPKRRYMVVPNQGEAERTIRKQIEQLAQLNEGHAYTYDRDALVKMLDESLAASRPKTK
ncbi:MAG: SDR family NAD(P)-dependent oxidoreductase [Steroidobacteraceae bacterium]